MNIYGVHAILTNREGDLHAKFPGAAPRYAGSPFGGILVVIAGMSLHGHIGVTMVS